jgi:predicted metal-binding membrane protein
LHEAKRGGVWIAGLTAIVIAEKMLPHARPVSQALGAAMIASGRWVYMFG